ncbi:helix-turn-helix domain-containing protein [Streptomyces xiamenensis]|uniref:telomere-protecting terminal protein Tpg n=1 Tax=Streptomyces xiamenensis TaxID=408015 RepID=UPI00344AB560
MDPQGARQAVRRSRKTFHQWSGQCGCPDAVWASAKPRASAPRAGYRLGRRLFALAGDAGDQGGGAVRVRIDGSCACRRTAPGRWRLRRDPCRRLVAGARPRAHILRQPVLSRECKNGQAGAGDVGELTRRTADAGPGGWPLREADVGQIEQGLERALRTRPVPASTEARLRFLLASHGGSTRQVATVLGVSQRTVQRWVTKKPGTRRPPGPLQVQAIEEAVLARWQPRIRARRRAQAEAEGFVFHTRARFGFAAPAGSSDDPRVRWITQDLPGEVARELFAARDAGAGEQQQTVILARALGHAYFREWGRRAHGLHIAFSDIEFADFSIG